MDAMNINLAISKIKSSKTGVLLALTFVFWFGLILVIEPDGGDWWLLFSQASILNPYLTDRYISLPMVPILVAPFKLFGTWSLAIMLAFTGTVVAMLTRNSKGDIDLFSLVAVYTSYPYLALIHTGQIEWIPLLGLLISGPVGAALLAMKPQAGILAGWIWFIRSDKKVSYFITAGLLLIVSFLIWGNWPGSMMENIAKIPDTNRWPGIMGVSIWPWGTPLGIALFVAAHKESDNRNSIVLAILSTLMLSPYFNVQSIIGLLSLAFPIVRRRAVIISWLLLWTIPIIY